MKIKSLAKFVLAFLLLLGVRPTQAQWVDHVVRLKGGWNAIYLPIDLGPMEFASIPADVWEIHLWNPAPNTTQFFSSPQEPTGNGSPWLSWIQYNTPPELNTLHALPGNRAYLVKVAPWLGDFPWTLRGKPLPPLANWTGTGQNLIGFPTDPNSPTSFYNFFDQVPAFRENLEVFHYPGGEWGSPVTAQMFSFLWDGFTVNQGQAYWLRNTNVFNRYFGPFEVKLANPKGLEFGEKSGQMRFHLKNHSKGPLQVTATLIPSLEAPAGNPPVLGVPPLLLRGEINPTNLTYPSIDWPLNGSQIWQMQAYNTVGSEVEVVLGLNRFAMTNLDGTTLSAGGLVGAVIRFTDSLGHLQIDIPVSALMASPAGLWVGEAAVDQVSTRIKTYAVATNNVQMEAVLVSLNRAQGQDGTTYSRDPNSNRILARKGNSESYVQTPFPNSDNTRVGRSAPLRLIVHTSDSGQSHLLQRVYYGMGQNSNLVVATSESLLDRANLSSARRISAAHLPWTEANQPWPFITGTVQFGAWTYTAPIYLDFDDQRSNPFLHTYHPDHDNRDAEFKPLGSRGVESYDVKRHVFMDTVALSSNDFDTLTSRGNTISGVYFETVEIFGKDNPDYKHYVVLGKFALKRISEIGTLTTQ